MRRKSSERVRGSQRDHAVAAESGAVHPVGHPISHSVNSGFKRIRDGSPYVEFARTWGPERKAMFASDTCRVIRSFMPGLSFQSRAIGVGHVLACVVREPWALSVRSPLRFKKVFCRSDVSDARGVSQWRAVSARPLPCVELVEPGSCVLGVGQYE